MVTLKKSLKNLQLDINVAKKVQFHVFFHTKQQIPRHGRKIGMSQNTAGPEYAWIMDIFKYYDIQEAQLLLGDRAMRKHAKDS